MKVVGTVAALVGAVSLMALLLVAQRDYQRSFSGNALTQTSTVSEAASAAPERIAFTEPLWEGRYAGPLPRMSLVRNLRRGGHENEANLDQRAACKLLTSIRSQKLTWS